MEHGGDAFTLWARKRDLTVEINRILYQLIIRVSFFWWLFHNREYRPTMAYLRNKFSLNHEYFGSLAKGFTYFARDPKYS